jgi:hypothetical protein
MYKNANHHICNERLSESEMCYERSGDDCDDEHQQVAPYVSFSKSILNKSFSIRCAVTDWSSFSPCSVSCGQGITERRRWYINENSQHDPKCKDIYLIEKRQCQGSDPDQCNKNENKGS